MICSSVNRLGFIDGLDPFLAELSGLRSPRVPYLLLAELLLGQRLWTNGQ